MPPPERLDQLGLGRERVQLPRSLPQDAIPGAEGDGHRYGQVFTAAEPLRRGRGQGGVEAGGRSQISGRRKGFSTR